MSAIDVNSSALAVETAETLIEAPLETVWQVLSDLDGWPTWNPGVSSMKRQGPFGVGTSFVWTAGGSRITSRLEEIAPPHRIVWTGKTMGIRAIHVWTLEAREAGTHVRTSESFEGLLVRLFSGPMKKMLAKALHQGLSALKTEAEARTRA